LFFSKSPGSSYFKGSDIIALEAATYSPNSQPRKSYNPVVAIQTFLSLITWRKTSPFVKGKGII
jgi:hypothetical protein